MKFLYALLAATNLAGSATKPLATNESTEIVERYEDRVMISDQHYTNLINKTFTKDDTELISRDSSDKQEMVFKNKGPTQLLLSKKQTEFLHNPRLTNVEISISYKLFISSDSVRGETSFRRIRDYWMDRERQDDSGFTLWDKEGKAAKIIFTEGDCRVMGNTKPDQDALEINPEIRIPRNNDYDFGHYIKLGVTNITISGKSNLYDLSSVKSEDINVTYNSVHKNNVVEDFIRSSSFEDYMHNYYGLPYDFVDKEETVKKAYIDLLNHTKENKIALMIVPNKKYEVEGFLIQNISFSLSKELIDRLDDFESIENAKSSNLYNLLYRNYFEPYELDVVIDFDNNVAKLNGYASTIKFDNDGELVDWNRFNKVIVVKGGKDIAQAYLGRWEVTDYVAFGDFAKSYFESIEAKKQDEKHEHKPEETDRDKEQALGDGDQDLKEELSKNNDEKVSSKKKSNPLKYLWLLTIPITFGLGGLISWFIPFRKKKKRSNDIK